MIRSPLEHIPRPEAGAAIVALLTAVALTGLKFFAYFLTNSAAVYSDAMESVVNVASATFSIYSLYLAHLPADPEHPYGHGKIEFMSAGFEGGMILLAGVVAGAKALETLLHPVELQAQRLDLGLALMAVALAVNGLLGFAMLRLGRRVASATLEADGHHLLSDAVTSVAAIASLVIVKATHWRAADPIAALAVAIYIGWIGSGLVRRAIGGLMDRQDKEDQRLLGQILDAHLGPGGKEPRICSYHKLRHRHSGRYHWVDFHIMVPGEWTIHRGHEVASNIEYEIEQALGIGNATARRRAVPGRDLQRVPSRITGPARKPNMILVSRANSGFDAVKSPSHAIISLTGAAVLSSEAGSLGLSFSSSCQSPASQRVVGRQVSRRRAMTGSTIAS